jgi:Plasmid replication region DNA-binding N-term
MTEAPKPYGTSRRGVSQGDVSQAADALLRLGERPTIDKIRASLGSGSPNTINPMLDAWWKRLASRLDAGPAALHRLPESVAHVAEALWMQALDEGRRRAQLELKSTARIADEQRQSLEVRSHVLTLREGEFDSRLRDRERTVVDLQRQLRELTLMLRKEQANRESQARQLTALQTDLEAAQRPVRAMTKPQNPKQAKAKRAATRRAPKAPKAPRNKKSTSGRR